MSGFEGMIIGAALAFIIGMAWKNHEPKSLYLYSFFSAMSGIASSTGYQPASEAPYAWGITIFLALLGFVLSRI